MSLPRFRKHIYMLLSGGSYRDRLPLFAILIGAFVLRIYGANFGLPNLYAWDESQVVTRAMRFASGDLNPHFFFYPGLYFYLLFVVNILHFVIGRLVGVYHSAAQFGGLFFLDPTHVYLVSRITDLPSLGRVAST